ncbi:unnamed protein product [Linum trigynum]|uniref:Uncharacterized protein n=1 Tax=Linum trigynum TaxID=586398 RepID=A0AAV2FAQ6_9ROSI
MRLKIGWFRCVTRTTNLRQLPLTQMATWHEQEERKRGAEQDFYGRDLEFLRPGAWERVVTKSTTAEQDFGDATGRPIPLDELVSSRRRRWSRSAGLR